MGQNILIYKTCRLTKSSDTSTVSSEPTHVPADIEAQVPIIEKRRVPESTSGEPSIIDWDNIVHKNARTTDNVAIGNVAAITDSHIVITSAGARDEFSIPKRYVQGYNGAEVVLNLSITDVHRFEI